MTSNLTPEHTAIRVALWRALHIQIDPKPHIFTDEIGSALVGEKDWRERPDMNPEFSKPMRASIVGRARFVEDLIEKQGFEQYVILGAGLDTFVQRRPEIASKITIYEIDQPGPQEWKKKRLCELGYEIPKYLHFVPVNFEKGESFWDQLQRSGFDKNKSSLVVSTGVSMYLTQEANLKTLEKLALLGKGSIYAMTFMLTPELLVPEERATLEFVMKKAKDSRTPFLSLFTPESILAMAKKAGFKEVSYVSANDIYKLYFATRSDGLRAGAAEAFLLAKT